MPPVSRRHRTRPATSEADRPGTFALTATGCGTAVAAVCAIGLFQIEELVGGIWSALAVVIGGAMCFLLARSLARLSSVVPSGAGLLAFLSRGLGRTAGLVLVAPYLLLTLLLLGAEANIVGVLAAHVLPLPPILLAIAFLVATWAICRAGVRIGFRAQAVATWALLACLMGLSILAIVHAGPDLHARLIRPAPSLAHFITAIGEALFLFMGFELLTSQAELAASPRAVGRALGGSVVVLTIFYATMSLGYSSVHSAGAAQTFALSGELQWAPQIAMAAATGGPVATLLIIGLTVLASFTSFNGALLAFSRFGAALAAQGVLPRKLGRLDRRTLVPRHMLWLLLALSVAFTFLLSGGGLLEPSILAAAVSASLVYAGVAFVRERAPFAEAGRTRSRAIAGLVFAGLLVALAVSVISGAGHSLVPVLALLIATSSAAVHAAMRVRTRVLVRAASEPPDSHRAPWIAAASPLPTVAGGAQDAH